MALQGRPLMDVFTAAAAVGTTRTPQGFACAARRLVALPDGECHILAELVVRTAEILRSSVSFGNFSSSERRQLTFHTTLSVLPAQTADMAVLMEALIGAVKQQAAIEGAPVQTSLSATSAAWSTGPTRSGAVCWWWACS